MTVHPKTDLFIRIVLLYLWKMLHKFEMKKQTIQNSKYGINCAISHRRFSDCNWSHFVKNTMICILYIHFIHHSHFKSVRISYFAHHAPHTRTHLSSWILPTPKKSNYLLCDLFSIEIALWYCISRFAGNLLAIFGCRICVYVCLIVDFIFGIVRFPFIQFDSIDRRIWMHSFCFSNFFFFLGINRSEIQKNWPKILWNLQEHWMF